MGVLLVGIRVLLDKRRHGQPQREVTESGIRLYRLISTKEAIKDLKQKIKKRLKRKNGMLSTIINGENEDPYFRSCSCWIEGWGFSRG